MTVTSCALIIAVLFSGAVALGQRGFPESSPRDDIVPGQFLVDPPTLENLGFRWYVDGDKNRNATVEVSYRVKGDEKWLPAQPMLRIRHEIVEDGNYRTGNLFAGSVMFLKPGTQYEVQFTMQDPDGGAPEAPKVVEVATRSEPEAWTEGQTLDVHPSESILAAFEKARPGDIIMLLPGVHEAKDAPYVLTKSGEPGKPIVFRGAGADKSIIEGPNLATDLFCLTGTHDIIFEDLTMRQAGTAIHTDLDHIRDGADPFALDAGYGGPGASDITIRRCRIENVVNAIWTCSRNSRNWLIADNVLVGANKKWHPFTAHEEAVSYKAINVYGQGHVVCYNKVNWFLLLIGTAEGCEPDWKDLSSFPVNIDFYNNELFYGIGDVIQTDYSAHNIRVYRNLCSNARCGLSTQPIFGGPVYLIRNEVFGITEHYNKWNNEPAGVIAWHNTVGDQFYTVPHSNCHLCNNLFLGGTNSTTLTPELHTMDYNGYIGNRFIWANGDVEKVTHNGLAAFAAATGYEKHGINITRADFVKAPEYRAGTMLKPGDFDLRLRPESGAIDSALLLPNINDDYRGAGPDRGAIEFGKPRVLHGPRVKIGQAGENAGETVKQQTK